MKNKPKFTETVDGGRPDMEKYNLADSMLTYINNSKGIIDGLHLTEDCEDADVYKPRFSKNKVIDYTYMETLIKAIQKLVIKDVVLFKDSIIDNTKTAIYSDKE